MKKKSLKKNINFTIPIVRNAGPLSLEKIKRNLMASAKSVALEPGINMMTVLNVELVEVHPIVNVEKIELSPVYTFVQYWFDISYQLPGYRLGTDPNTPSCALYQNGVLISQAWFNPKTITLELVEQYLEGEHHKNLHWLRVATNYEPIPEFI